jgi:catechol 2,3-dioxygenase-like lactoylglutathione lyase family enzyme
MASGCAVRLGDLFNNLMLAKEATMITGAHLIVYTDAAEEAREFLRDGLGLPNVDAGGGWLIFALPPAQLAVHPATEPHQELYLMCDQLEATMAELEAKGATFDRPPREADWGWLVTMSIPGGTRLELYQPSHARPTR